MTTPSTTTDPRPWETSAWVATHELVARSLYESDWRKQIGIAEGEPWPTDRRITWDDLAGPRGDEIRGNYLRLARAAVAAMRRAEDLPDVDDIGDDVLDDDRVARIAWAYDPAGTIYNDIHRLARSHANLAARHRLARWALGYIAHKFARRDPHYSIPAAIAGIVTRCRAETDGVSHLEIGNGRMLDTAPTMDDVEAATQLDTPS